MPPPARTNRSLTSGRPSTSTPMSERQQMALLLQMTTSTESGGKMFGFVLTVAGCVVLIQLIISFRIGDGKWSGEEQAKAQRPWRDGIAYIRKEGRLGGRKKVSGSRRRSECIGFRGWISLFCFENCIDSYLMRIHFNLRMDTVAWGGQSWTLSHRRFAGQAWR